MASFVKEFSAAGIAELCADVEFSILNEHPDSASSNGRKKAKTSQQLPSNCLFVNGVCDAHQAHRVVELREKDVVGNVHAIAVSAANREIQNKLQLSLQSLLGELVFLRGGRLEHGLLATRSGRSFEIQWTRG